MSSEHNPSTTAPPHERSLLRSSVLEAHELIKAHIHKTPVLTNTTLNHFCSTPRSANEPSPPKINLFLKCENFQKVGAFKYRGATHALLHLLSGTSSLPISGAHPDPSTLRQTGVITHSSGNHAQALALAARTLSIPATIVMPHISTPSKIAATRSYGAKVVFSGSTSAERESVVAQLMAQSPGMVLVPPYDAVDIMLGQGTLGLELAEQVAEMIAADASLSVHGAPGSSGKLDAVIAPVGGGGMLSGVALSFAGTGTRVFGAEPSFQGADDCKRGLEAQSPGRIAHVSSLTVADGVRTPVGVLPWSVISNRELVGSVFSVGEEEILTAMRLVWERVKIVVEPTAALGVAVVLFCEEFREMVRRLARVEGKDGWDVGVVISGGNVDLNAAGELLAKGVGRWEVERGLGVVGVDGDVEPVVQDVAG